MLLSVLPSAMSSSWLDESSSCQDGVAHVSVAQEGVAQDDSVLAMSKKKTWKDTVGQVVEVAKTGTWFLTTTAVMTILPYFVLRMTALD